MYMNLLIELGEEVGSHRLSWRAASLVIALLCIAASARNQPIADRLLQNIMGWLSRPCDTHTQLNHDLLMALMAYPHGSAKGRITNST
ncbi:hypothetical protein BGZ60DRAFT_421910 [Tricladium varicosporioides]|nr:hypothetical protein BGZ60DRAFT_421910 [Hymenoscyphus varicosporioides]